MKTGIRTSNPAISVTGHKIEYYRLIEMFICDMIAFLPSISEKEHAEEKGHTGTTAGRDNHTEAAGNAA
ncbi:MAG: hypothetical protein ACE5KM_22615, partial [Planctomycetaceae bacterium]